MRIDTDEGMRRCAESVLRVIASRLPPTVKADARTRVELILTCLMSAAAGMVTTAKSKGMPVTVVIDLDTPAIRFDWGDEVSPTPPIDGGANGTHEG